MLPSPRNAFHPSSDPNQSSNSTNLLQNSIRKNMKEYFEELRKTEQKRYKKYKLIGWLFHQPDLLAKDRLFLSHLRNIDEEYLASSIEAQINSFESCKLDKSVRDVRQSVFLGSSEFFGMYDHIIKKIVRKDAIKLRVYEVLCGIFLLGFCSLLAWIVQRNINLGNSKTELKLIFAAIGCLICFLLTFCFSILKSSQFHKISLKVRQALNIFVNKKLNSSDSYFLEHSDNNMIYKLLYLEFEDYIKYAHNTVGLWIVGAVIIFSAFVLGTFHRNFGIPLVVSLLLNLINCILTELFQIKQQTWYKAVKFEQRKLLHEFIQNFKSFTLMNLKERIEIHSKELLKARSRSVSKHNLLHSVSKTTSLLVFNFFFLSLFFNFVYHTDPGSKELCKAQEYHEINKHKIRCLNGKPVDSASYQELMLPLCLVLFILDYFINRASTSISAYFSYKSAKITYDKFFQNDFVVFDQIQTDSSLPPGTIKIVNCSVSVRSTKNINITLNQILQKNKDFSSLRSIKLFRARESLDESGKESSRWTSRMKKSASIKSPNSKLHSASQIKKLEVQANDSKSARKFRVLFKNLTMEVPAGSKVCLYNVKNKKFCKGFISMILGEAFISEGAVVRNGTVSFFNPNNMHFLVGKSIRDNIIYGEEYKGERYEAILKLLNLNFGNYYGYDFYQISERAANLKNEDRRAILIARFLYKDSSTYIIEDYFSKVNVSLVLEVFKQIFSQRMKGRTVLYDAADLELVKLSNYVLTFDRLGEASFLPTTEFLQRLGETGSRIFLDNEDAISRKRHRSQIFQTKQKNSVFLENVSYEEELIVFKKKEAAAREIQKVIDSKPSTLELLSYGIYLTNKRRQEGVNLEEPLELRPSVVWKELKRIIRDPEIKKAMVYTSLLLLIISITRNAIYLAIILKYPRANSSQFRSMSSLIQWIGIWISGLVLTGIKQFLLSRYLSKSLLELNNKILSSILNSGIRGILTKKSHRILDKIGNDVMEIETNLLLLIESLASRMIDFIVLCLAQVVVYSFLLPALIIGLTTFMVYWIEVRLTRFGVKILHIESQVGARTNDINFQLLGLVRSFRISGLVSLLLKRQLARGDHKAKVFMLRDVHFRSFVEKLFYLVSSFWCAAFFGIHIAFRVWPELRLISFNENVYMWGYLNWFKICITMFVLPSETLRLIKFTIATIQISTWLQGQAQKVDGSVLDSIKRARRKNYNFSAPILFKNVSLTLGFQPILKKINIKFQAGEITGIYGFDGGGRSTIFELLSGILERDSVEKSEIHVFGVKIEDLEHDVLKREIFLMARDPVLLEGRIRDNIDPYGTLSRKELKEKLLEMDFSSGFRRDTSPRSLEKKHVKLPSLKLKPKIQPQDVSRSRIAKKASIDSCSDNISKEQVSKQMTIRKMGPAPALVPFEQSKAKYEKRIIGEIDTKSNGLSDSQHTVKYKKKLSDKTPRASFNPVVESNIGNDRYNSSLKTVFRGFFDVMKTQPKQSPAVQQQDNPTAVNRRSVYSIPQINISTENLPDIDTKLAFVSKVAVNQNPSEQDKPLQGASFSEASLRFEKNQQSNLLRLRKIDVELQDVAEEDEKSDEDPHDTYKVMSDLPPVKPMVQLSDIAAVLERFGEDENEFYKFLDTRVGFEGNNIELETRRYIIFCRAVLSQPKILLVYEESLSFGQGTAFNLQKMSDALPHTTIICILQNADHILKYSQVVFLDGGMVVEKGDPNDLLNSPASYVHKFLKETDHLVLHRLVSQAQDIKSSGCITGKDSAISNSLHFEELEQDSLQPALPQAPQALTKVQSKFQKLNSKSKMAGFDSDTEKDIGLSGSDSLRSRDHPRKSNTKATTGDSHQSPYAFGKTITNLKSLDGRLAIAKKDSSDSVTVLQGKTEAISSEMHSISPIRVSAGLKNPFIF